MSGRAILVLLGRQGPSEGPSGTNYSVGTQLGPDFGRPLTSEKADGSWDASNNGLGPKLGTKMMDLPSRTRIRQCVAIWVPSGVRLVGVVHRTSGPQLLPPAGPPLLDPITIRNGTHADHTPPFRDGGLTAGIITSVNASEMSSLCGFAPLSEPSVP